MNLNSSISMGATAVVIGLGLPFAALADSDIYTAADKSRFIEAMIAANCHVTDNNAKIVVEMTGFSDTKLSALVEDLAEVDLIVEDADGEGITLINKGCP